VPSVFGGDYRVADCWAEAAVVIEQGAVNVQGD
jgi:hypothetical protein